MRDEIKSAPYVGPYVNMAYTSKSWHMGNDEVMTTAFNTMITNVLSGKTSQTEIEKAAQTITTELQSL
jgi:hypothetical protein